MRRRYSHIFLRVKEIPTTFNHYEGRNFQRYSYLSRDMCQLMLRGNNEEPALHGSLEFIIKHSCNMLLGKIVSGMRTHNEVFF